MTMAVATGGSAGAADRMNRMYRHQRHVYNITRKYYLLGRDRLIGRLNPEPGDCVLEIGCGTGRNLIRIARHYPDARVFGIDISSEMLASANRSIVRHQLSSRVRVATADAAEFNPTMLLGRAQYDRIVISYSLSMIPDWRSVLPLAYSLLQRGGELHIVDFGDFESMPAWFGIGMRRWLARFDVMPCDELECDLTELAWRTRAPLSFERPYKGYAQYAIVRRP